MDEIMEVMPLEESVKRMKKKVKVQHNNKSYCDNKQATKM